MTQEPTILEEIFTSGHVQHPDGTKLRVGANISRENSDALRRLVIDVKPRLVVEIGMAFGVSTLSILEAIKANRSGRLISIDPYVGWPTGRLVALHQVERAGMSSHHQHLHEPSYTGLPRLIDSGERADVVYIDGNHDYDFAFTDFFLADKLLAPGGIVAFNDCGWRSVFQVVRYVSNRHDYAEIDVGLPRAYRSSNTLFALIKRLEGRSSNDRYFRKK